MNDNLFASVGVDGSLKMWDLKNPKSLIAAIRAHAADVLSCDFSKYEEVIATSSADKTIKLWDVRKL